MPGIDVYKRQGILAVLLFIIIGFVFLNGYFLKDLFSDPVRCV